jgi:hypothetical protein
MTLRLLSAEMLMASMMILWRFNSTESARRPHLLFTVKIVTSWKLRCVISALHIPWTVIPGHAIHNPTLAQKVERRLSVGEETETAPAVRVRAMPRTVQFSTFLNQLSM